MPSKDLFFLVVDVTGVDSDGTEGEEVDGEGLEPRGGRRMQFVGREVEVTASLESCDDGEGFDVMEGEVWMELRLGEMLRLERRGEEREGSGGFVQLRRFVF